MITVIAGGVGAARFLRGLFTVVDQSDVTVIGNTGDDLEMYGLHISPDLDTVTYTTAEANNTETGWGLAGETWAAMAGLKRFGVDPWFNLGDTDLSTHLYRTSRLAEGASLDQVTAEITKAFGLRYRLIPMSNDLVRTKIELINGDTVDFQEYFVHQRHETHVTKVTYGGAPNATPSPGVLDAIVDAEVVIVAPSNPILSIGPILAVPGIADALMKRRETVVGISPIVGGTAIKGPADHLMSELGHEPSVSGVAKILTPYISSLIIDNADVLEVAEVEQFGVSAVVTNTIMSDLAVSGDLARTTIAAARAPEDLR